MVTCGMGVHGGGWGGWGGAAEVKLYGRCYSVSLARPKAMDNGYGYQERCNYCDWTFTTHFSCGKNKDADWPTWPTQLNNPHEPPQNDWTQLLDGVRSA
jgi:hypothetical protein